MATPLPAFALSQLPGPRPRHHTPPSRITMCAGRPQRRVIVVGAGLSGLAVSLRLADLGHAVTLLEKRPDFTALGAAFLLNRSGVRALREIAPAAFASIDAKFAFKGHLSFPWYILRDALLAQVRARPGAIDLRTAASISAIDVGDPLLVRASVDVDGASHEFVADLLLACDGINSKVRKIVGLPPAAATGATNWRGMMSVPDTWPLLAVGPYQRLLLGGYVFLLINYHSVLPNVMAWAVHTKLAVAEGSDVRELVKAVGFGEGRAAEVVSATFKLADEVDVKKTMHLKLIDLADWTTDDGEEHGGWGGRGRVAFLGDAAHAMCHVSALGSSMAFEDCAVLCRIVEEVGDLGDRGPEVVARFESERLPRVSRISKMEKFLSDSVHSGSPADDVIPPEYWEWVHSGV